MIKFKRELTAAGLGCAMSLSLIACEPKKDDVDIIEEPVAEAPDEESGAAVGGAQIDPPASQPAVNEEPAAAALGEPSGTGPEDASGATTAPVPGDIARYTEGLGEGTLRAQIKTSMGTLTCELYEEKAPLTVANFVGLARGMKAWTMPVIDRTKMPPVQPGEVKVETPLYDGTICHRVIPEFMIQCGDPSGTGMGNPGYKFKDEFHPSLKHDRGGLLSMANSGPGTNGSQFFVTEVATPHLNNRHTVFGACDDVELVKKIARVEVGQSNKPKEDIKIETITIFRGDEPPAE